MAEGPIPLSEVLAEEYVRLHVDEDPAAKLPPAGASETETLKHLFKAIHELKPGRSALCISGGGIRSATFALGVIQRLAKVGVLDKFDYLSTVSGGGYIGSWLSSYARRTNGGMQGVSTAIAGNTNDPLQPEVSPLMWLRRFSNYLTPRLGLLSGDTWAFAGSYIRNLLLVWLMFVPLLIAALAVPRLSIAMLRHENGHAPIYLIIAAAAFLFAATALALTRPVSYRKEGWLTNKRFQWCVFVPFLIAAVCLLLYWGPRSQDHPENIHWSYVYGAFIILSATASSLYMIRFILAGMIERRGSVRLDSSVMGYNVKKFIHELLAAAASGAVGAALCQASAKWLFDDPLKTVKLPQLADWTKVPAALSTAPGEVFLCFGVPLVLGILFIQSTIFIGGASWFNEEYDREWWGRAAGWVLVAAVIWIVFTVIAIYGPVLLYNVPKTLAALGGVTGLISILGGKSGKTAANQKEEDETAKPAETGTNIALGLAAPVFVVIVLAGLSLVTSRVMFPIQANGLPKISDTDFDHYSQLPDSVKKRLGQHQVAGCTDTLQCPEIDPWKERAMEHLWSVDHATVAEGLILVIGAGLFGVFASYFLGVNQFSMHGLYRNRLVRAYLGASRLHRKPNAFSGFDPNDNMTMQLLRPETFRGNSFSDPVALGKLLAGEPNVRGHVQPRTQDALGSADTDDLRFAAAEMLADDLNRVIDSVAFDPDDRKESPLPLSVRNRQYLEKRYGNLIASYRTHRRPIHVVNTALNLVAGENLAWQERKAESFGISPFYSGSWVRSDKSGAELGYRHTREYGGPAGITLGTAVAISGAAASPNMGYHSSPALSFLLTLFNVRLGWWLGNTGRAGDGTYQNQNPTFSLYPLVCEALGATNDTFPYIYLSDGGHFDNLGLYEMVLRRCRHIVVSDGGGDPRFDFEDLGNAIRKIRIDLGINITIRRVMGLYPRNHKDPVKPIYCAVADIDYSKVDSAADPNNPGKLLYIKPAFYGKEEPKDVYNYAVANATFPHQTTGDQWFSESQFESYRALGEFELTKINNGQDTFGSIGDLITEAEQYIRNEGP